MPFLSKSSSFRSSDGDGDDDNGDGDGIADSVDDDGEPE